jgi:serine/threonine protein kinase
LIDGCNLLDYIISHGPFDEAEARIIFAQIVSAVHYLHITKSVVHRDLKLENILLTSSGSIKLIDFGFAYLNRGPTCEQWGSKAYAAPEIFLGTPYDQSIDLWSLGVVLYAMVCGSLPSKTLPPEIPEILSVTLRDLMQRLLAHDPKERIDINGVKTHAWSVMSPNGTEELTHLKWSSIVDSSHGKRQ